MRKLSIHIVEDESIIAQDLKEIIEELGHRIDGVSMSFDEVIKKLPTINADLFLLDIMLNEGKTGIDVAEELKKRHIPFVFVSSITEKVMIERVKETAPYGFILKPFNPADVFISLEMAIARVEIDRYGGAVYLSVGSGKERVPLSSILYAQADGNYSNIYVNNRKFTVNDNLKTVHATTLSHSMFKRVHKSYVVNVNTIIKVLKHSLLLTDNIEIPKSRGFKLD